MNLLLHGPHGGEMLFARYEELGVDICNLKCPD